MIMTSVQATADSVRNAVRSPSTCSPATASILSDLLLPKSLVAVTNIPADTRSRARSTTKPNARAASRATSRAPAKSKAKTDQENLQPEHLSPKQRSILATEVINATLKALSEADRPPIKKQASSRDMVKNATRKPLRRSNSLPPSPLQSRSLNRVSSVPAIAFGRSSRSSSAASCAPSGKRYIAECARIAFACLRTLQLSKTAGLDFAPLQIESGMSVLVGKLVLLGLDDLAVKEVRILKRRLETDDRNSSVKTVAAPKEKSQPVIPTLGELLDFGKCTTGPRLNLVIATQLHILRLIVTAGKPRHIETALSVVSLAHISSPINLILLAAKDPQQSARCARQLQVLSEILFSLSPSVSSSDDIVAVESKLKVCPESALSLQVLAFHCRLKWWKLAGHKGAVGKDMLEPLLRCLSAFARRSTLDPVRNWNVAMSAFTQLEQELPGHSESNSAYRPVLLSIYRLLGSLSKQADHIKEAVTCFEKAQQLLDPSANSDAKRCAITARLVALTLREPSDHPQGEDRLIQLIDDLEGPLKGDSLDLDDVLTELSSARRAAIAILSKRDLNPNPDSKQSNSESLLDRCESLVFLCPRFALRYLGRAPGDGAASKDIVRYEQRKAFTAKTSFHSIDSALFLIKSVLTQARLSWESMDSICQDCLTLLDRLDASPASPTSYYVKISNLYYTKYLSMRRDSEGTEDDQQLRILQRSLDCVRSRPPHERASAVFSIKLERMAELCKSMGRYDDLFNTLVSLRDDMIANLVLSDVAEAAGNVSIHVAWSISDGALALARTLHSLVKIALKYPGSASGTWFQDESWSPTEKGAALEQELEILTSANTNRLAALGIRNQVAQNLLSVYTIDDFPLRRLRVLTRMLTFDPASCEDVGKIKDLLAPLLAIVDAESTNDNGLQNFVVHWQTLATCRLELQSDVPDAEVLRQCLTVWGGIRARSENLVALELQIEDLPGLLLQLQSVSDFMQMKGFDTMRLATLRLTAELKELQDYSTGPDGLILSYTALGNQWLHLGYSGKAGLAFDKAHTYNKHDGVTAQTRLRLHLSYSEYLLAIGNFEKCEEHLLLARALSGQDRGSVEFLLDSSAPLSLQQKTTVNCVVATASVVHSMLALERGSPQLALTHAKQALRLLRRAWVNTEEQLKRERALTNEFPKKEVEKLSEDLTQLSVSAVNVPAIAGPDAAIAGVMFWPMISPLLRSMIYVSGLYAHHGMYLETLYYAETAFRLAEGIGSDEFMGMAAASIGNIYLTAGDLDRGSNFLLKAKELCVGEKNKRTVILSCNLAQLHGALGEHAEEMSAYEEADAVVKHLSDATYFETMDRIVDGADSIEGKMSMLTIEKKKGPVTRRGASKARPPVKRQPVKRAKTPVQIEPFANPECPQLNSLRAIVIRQKANALMMSKKCGEAMDLLDEADQYSISQLDVVDQRLAVAKQLLLRSIEQMSADPVYSVLQDSTISFPSVALKNLAERLSVTKPVASAKVQMQRGVRPLSKSPTPDSFFDKLRQAQEHLTEAYSIAMSIAPVAVIHKITGLLNNVAILLSAAGPVKGKSLAHPGFASCSIETAKTISFRREHKVIKCDANNSAKEKEALEWPTITPEAKRASVGGSLLCDLPRFQRDYIDIIPKSWTAISMSISEDQQELLITRLQADQSPFVLRLPLGRNNSLDADEEVFGFEQGRAELREILRLGNETAHDARNRTGKQAKQAWWDEREALDARLRDLLENVERVWLGGFRGIFSQHSRQPDLLARFQRTFQNILDKHLPSRRQKTKKKAPSPRVALDSRILELFIGLGDASQENCDLADPLMDLLYFVVDVLQFHGELNAYAEVDFDSIVVDVSDALRSYHAAARTSVHRDEGSHTILILDKPLHSFPWESLPCLDGLAVSRLPSLGCLRDRILAQEEDADRAGPDGHYIERDNGAYILNPEGDLKTTQAMFEKSLQTLSEWDGIVNREPSGEEMISCHDKDLLLYFGHGSGAQYIRAKDIRTLDKCAVTVLMGCSSGALTEAGEFELYGPPTHYMHAGCPALVATLWDVTDKDIDRFAQRVFENWGLLETPESLEMANRGRSRKKLFTNYENKGKMSLVEAVAKGREACHLRYLNAAAVCVYGVPVYIK